MPHSGIVTEGTYTSELSFGVEKGIYQNYHNTFRILPNFNGVVIIFAKNELCCIS